jgi:hypothetical protein
MGLVSEKVMLKVQNHNYNVLQALSFQGKPKGGIFYGVELELEIGKSRVVVPVPKPDEEGYCCYSCHPPGMTRWKEPSQDEEILYVEKILGDFVCLKEDGSLKFGLEIVSAPASLQVHRNRWKGFFDTIPKTFKSAKNCGLHIHVSKEPLTHEQQWRVHQFVNSPTNKEFIKRIAGRGSGQYCERKCKSIQEVTDESTKGAGQYPYSRKYGAVNLLPKDSLEVRIFASTTSYQTFMERLEFTAAMVQWVKEENPLKEQLLSSTLREWIEGQEKIYPAFTTWLKEQRG